jgi:hypothetical protein
MPPNSISTLAPHEQEMPANEPFSHITLDTAPFSQSHPGSGGNRDVSEHKEKEDDSSDRHKGNLPLRTLPDGRRR